jgi:hypothetical protein
MQDIEYVRDPAHYFSKTALKVFRALVFTT